MDKSNSQSTQSDTLTQSNLSDAEKAIEARADEIRNRIVGFLRPFLHEEDQTGKMLFTLLRKMLPKAELSTLLNVVYEVKRFADDFSDVLDADTVAQLIEPSDDADTADIIGLTRSGDNGSNSDESGGPSAIDREIRGGQISPEQANSDSLAPGQLETEGTFQAPEDGSDRLETAMARHPSGDGAQLATTLQEDGAR